MNLSSNNARNARRSPSNFHRTRTTILWKCRNRKRQARRRRRRTVRPMPPPRNRRRGRARHLTSKLSKPSLVPHLDRASARLLTSTTTTRFLRRSRKNLQERAASLRRNRKPAPPRPRLVRRLFRATQIVKPSLCRRRRNGRSTSLLLPKHRSIGTRLCLRYAHFVVILFLDLRL